MPTLVSTGRITINDVNDGLNARLTNDAHVVPTQNDGTGGDFTGCNSTMSVWMGKLNDTSNWTITATPIAGVTGSLSGATYTVTAMTIDIGTVDFKATRKGFPDQTVRFSITKARRGAAGSAGNPGATGLRGNLTVSRSISGSAWDDAQAEAAIVAQNGVVSRQGDIVTLYNTLAGFSQTRILSSGGSWTTLTAFFGGNVIVDGTLTASKLVITDTTNLIDDGGFEKGGGSWPSNVISRIVTEASPRLGGSKVLTVTATGNVQDFNYPYIECQPGDQFYGECWIRRNSSDTNGSAGFQATITKDGASQTYPGFTSISAAYMTVGVWTKLAGIITIPADKNRLLVRLSVRNDATTGSYSFDDVVLRRVNEGNLIVDGGITAAKIAADAVTAGAISAGAVVTDKLAANAVTAAKIAANTITAAQIAAGAITANEIAANTITAAKIAANTITAAQIAAGTITATQIAANAITATQIAAGSVSADKVAANAITASKLLVADVTNFILDAQFADTAYWSIISQTINKTDTAQLAALGVTAALRSQDGNGSMSQSEGYSYQAPTQRSPVEGGAKYRVSYEWHATIGYTGTLAATVYWYGPDGTNLSTSTVPGYADFRPAGAAAEEASTGTVSGLITAPANATALAVRFRSLWSTVQNNAGVGYIANPIVNRAVSSELIVDGSITASKLAIGASTMDSVVVRGGSTNAIAVGGVWVNGANLGTGSRGHSIYIYDRSTHAFVSRTSYDTFSSPQARVDFTAALNALDATKVVMIATHDACGYTADMVTALKRIGASSALDSLVSTTGRNPYALVGIPGMGEGNGVEQALPTISVVRAEVSTLWVNDLLVGATSSIGALTKLGSTYIADGAITTAKVFAGAITANEIAANTITAAKIAANTITATQIASGTITAGQIAAGAITATQIAAATITADRIAVGAITARELAVGDFTNLIPNGDMAAPQAGALPTHSNVSLITDTTETYLSKPYALLINSAAATTWATWPNSRFSVQPGDELYFEMWVKTSEVVGSTTVGIRYNNNAGGQVTATAAPVPIGTSGWTKVTRSWLVPNGAVSAAMQFNISHTAGTCTLGSIRLLRKNAGNLIVDGGIVANQLKLGTISQNLVWNGSPDISDYDTDGWYIYQGTGSLTTSVTTIPGMGAKRFNFNKGANGGAFSCRPFSVVPGTTYRVKFTAQTTATTTSGRYIRMGWTSNLAASGNITDGNRSGVSELVAGNSGWSSEVVEYDLTWTAPAGAKMATLAVYSWATGPDGLYVDNFEIYAVNAPATLIGPGFVHSSSIVANSITAAQISANAITANEIAAGTITAAEIAANAVTTAKIATGAVTANEIAANTITAAKIAAATITATQIAASTITATQIATNAITADKINANAVTTAKIATNAVTANEIAAGTITAAEIAANAITTAKIAANAVTATQIAAATITAAEIAAGAINATHIAAGSITTNKMIVADYSQILLDPYFEDTTAWTHSTSHSVVTRAADSHVNAMGNAPRGLKMSSTGVNSRYMASVYYNGGSSSLPCKAGAEYRATMKVRVTNGFNANGFIQILWQKADGTTSTVQSNTSVNFASCQTTAATADATLTVNTMKFTAPSDAAFAKLQIYSDWSDTWATRTNAGNCYMTEPRFYLATQGEMIVDGAITTDKLFADAVTTAKIAANAVTANEIAANAITAGKIAANTITAAQIAAATITATQIAASTITATQIAASTITATQIASNAITADKVNANAITTVKIATNAVTANEIAAGTITAAEIASNAITTAKIAAGAVTATQIAAGTITAAQIAAGTITASLIATNAISASKLLVSDAANYVLDPLFSDESYWSIVGGGTYSTDATQLTALGTNKMFKSANGNGTTSQGENFVMPQATQRSVVEGGSQYRLSAGWYVSSGFTGYPFFRVFWYKADGTAASPSNATVYAPDYRFTAATAETAGTLNGIVTAPADAVYASPSLRVAWSGTLNNTGNAWLATPVMNRAMSAELIVDGAVIAAKIATDAVTAVKIAANAITTDKLNANAVTAAKIAANTITASQIAAATITAAQIAASTITATQIATNAITSDKINANAITAAKIAAGTITANELAADSVTTAKIATNAVTATQIAAGTITAAEIAANAITTVKIAAGAVSTDQLAANAITAAKIAANTITASQIAGSTITATQMAANSITATQIATNAVTTDKINAGAITAAKISVTSLSAITATLGRMSTRPKDGSNVEYGQGTVIDSNLITVYNSSGVVKMRMGIW